MGSRLKHELHTPPPTQGACNLQIVPGVFPTGVVTDRQPFFPLFPTSQLATRLGACNVFPAFPNLSSGRSAAWFSAFDWGSKGREFESLRPDHLKSLNFNELGLFSLLTRIRFLPLFYPVFLPHNGAKGY